MKKKQPDAPNHHNAAASETDNRKATSPMALAKPMANDEFPIDAKMAALYEFLIYDKNNTLVGAVASMLAVGDGLQNTKLETGKGTITINKAKTEYFFSATKNFAAPKREGKVVMDTVIKVNVSRVGWAPIKTAITKSPYLRDQTKTNPLPATLTGQADAVTWSSSQSDLNKISGMITYAKTIEGIEYGVTFELNGQALKRIYVSQDVITTSGPAPTSTVHKGVDAFPYKTNHTPDYIYII